MKLAILHIIQDQKFSDSAYELFESVASGQSEYLLPESQKPIKYLKKIQPRRISRFSFLNPFFLKSIEKYDVVILHALTEFNRELVLRCSSDVNFLWVGLGYDYYDVIYKSKLDLLEPITRLVVTEHVADFMGRKPRCTIKNLARRLIYTKKTKREAIERIKWFAPVLDCEYELFSAAVPGLEKYPQYIDWNYAITAKLIENEPPILSSKANNILVGNSASPYNNHFEAFALLESLDIPVLSKIIVPLSYGNSNYRKKVIEEGERLFGDKFFPLTDFMPFDEYMSIISTCSTVIMNHNRQQAGGNITSALYMGARVFLKAKNSFYAHYLKHGGVIFDIEQLIENKTLLYEPLGSKDVENNRNVIQLLRSRSVIEEKTRKLIETVCEHAS